MTDGRLKKESVKEGKTVRVAYDGFRLFPTEEKGKLTAAYSENCSCADGVLQGGIGYERYLARDGALVKAAFAESARKFFLLEGWTDGEGTEPKNEYFILNDDGYIYQYSSVYDGYVKKANLGANADMVAAIAPDGKTKFVISGEKGACRVDGEEWALISEVREGKGAAAICFSKNRVFLGELPCKLLYGNPEAPWEFVSSYDDGGYVYLPLNKGDIVDIAEYGDSVYIFFQRGIMRLKPDGLARNFQISETTYFGGEIFGGSVGVCGNWIFFLTENGICRFDGNDAEKVGRFLNVAPMKYGQKCAHATVGEYFVLQYEDEEAGGTRTVALRADGKDGYVVSNYVGLNECNRMPICVVENYFATLRQGGELPSGAERVFLSADLELGGVGRKHLKSITLYGEGCMMLDVLHDWEEKRFEVEDLPLKTTIKVGVTAEQFRLHFVLDKGAKVRRVVLEYEKIDG